MPKIYSHGQVTFTVASGERIAILSASEVDVYHRQSYPNYPNVFVKQATTTADVQYISSAFTADTEVRLEASEAEVTYEVGSDATVRDTRVSVTRNTIADAGTLTAAQHQDLVIFQDASGGAVTCTTLTGTLLAAAFPDMAVGDSRPLYHASNHATNTSTVSGGTGVTLVGSGAVVNTGGQYLLIKTAAATFDLVRVG